MHDNKDDMLLLPSLAGFDPCPRIRMTSGTDSMDGGPVYYTLSCVHYRIGTKYLSLSASVTQHEPWCSSLIAKAALLGGGSILATRCKYCTVVYYIL